MKKGIFLIVSLMFFTKICFGQEKTIFGTYYLNKSLHLFNPLCSKSKLIIKNDSTYTYIDCDWLHQDTLNEKCKINYNIVELLNYKGNGELKLYYKKGKLYKSKYRRFFNFKDYVKVKKPNFIGTPSF